jgi:hypothetical protein
MLAATRRAEEDRMESAGRQVGSEDPRGEIGQHEHEELREEDVTLEDALDDRVPEGEGLQGSEDLAGE